MANCLKCGTPLDAGAKFCYKCGEAAAELQALVSEPVLAEDDYSAALKRAEARAAGEAEPVQTASASEPVREVKSESGYTAYASNTANGGSSYSGKSSFIDDGNVSTWQRAKNLASAMGESEKGRAKMGRIVFVAALVLLAAMFLFVTLKPQQGYSTPQALVKDYVACVTEGGTTAVLKFYEPSLVKFYETSYNRSDIPYIVDTGMADGVYPYVKSWYMADTLDWNPDDYYAEEFRQLGISAKAGKDVQVFFTVRTDSGDLTDYYVFEMIETNTGWWLLTVYYEQ